LISELGTGMKLILPKVVQILRYIIRRRGRVVPSNIDAANEERNSSHSVGIIFLRHHGSSIQHGIN
jgi:sortase (surface protein transpeptidase)